MADLAKWITQARYDEYLVAANHDSVAAQELYEWNVAVSASFYELLAHVEVSLRNAVDTVMKPLEVVETARLIQRAGWWFASASFLREVELKYFETARRHLGEKANSAGRDKLLSSMTFGIWHDLFTKDYEPLFRQHLVHAFPFREKGLARKNVEDDVRALRNLRNRIAHHQAIFDLPLEERFEQAMEMLHRIDPDLESWVRGKSRVPKLLNEKPTSADPIAVVVPATEAWPFYQSTRAYVCQPGRFFRQVSHVSFYASGAIQTEVPKILERIDHVNWHPEEIGRLKATMSGRDSRIADVIREARSAGWTEAEYQLFLLTEPGADGEAKGHVTLSSSIPQPRKGRGSAWVRRQRYAAVDAMRTAKTVADLD